LSGILAFPRQTFPTLVKRPVPKEWDERLAEFSPTTNRMQWLKIIHEPGYPWEPVDRFIIYEMMPAEFMEKVPHGTDTLLSMVLEQLQHPVPPSEMGGYYDHALQEYVANPDCLITTRAWDLFRETACWGRPYWIIKGTTGGHKREFSQVEQKLLRLHGLPSDAPAAGALPFAEFDDRVMSQLRGQDMLRGVHDRLSSTRATTAAQGQLRQERLEREFREALIKFLFAQVADVAPAVHKSLVAMDAPRSNADPRTVERLAEEAEEAFIETGRTDGLITIAR